jgi:hypothetical protein
MRRAILAVALGGVLLTAAACDSDADSKVAAPAPAPTSEPASTAPDYSDDTALICGRLEKIYNDDLEGFSTQIGRMIAYKEAKQPAEALQAQKAAGVALKGVGVKVQKETAVAQDPELKAAGATSAAKFVKSAADAGFYARIKTAKDWDRSIEGQMAEWLTPVAGHCH